MQERSGGSKVVEQLVLVSHDGSNNHTGFLVVLCSYVHCAVTQSYFQALLEHRDSNTARQARFLGTQDDD